MTIIYQPYRGDCTVYRVIRGGRVELGALRLADTRWRSSRRWIATTPDGREIGEYVTKCAAAWALMEAR